MIFFSFLFFSELKKGRILFSAFFLSHLNTFHLVKRSLSPFILWLSYTFSVAKTIKESDHFTLPAILDDMCSIAIKYQVRKKLLWQRYFWQSVLTNHSVLNSWIMAAFPTAAKPTRKYSSRVRLYSHKNMKGYEWKIY